MPTRLTKKLLSLPRAAKRLTALSVDVILCLATVGFAYYLRLDHWNIPHGAQWISYAASLIIAIPLFITFGLYRAIFRYAGWGALVAVVKAWLIYAILYSAVFTGIGVVSVPRTVGIIQPLLLLLAIGASRTLTRYWLNGGHAPFLRLSGRRRVLVYGAGAAGRQLAAALENSEEMTVVCFVDDDVTLQGSVLNGLKIYPVDGLADRVDRLSIDVVLLAVPSASRRRRHEIITAVRGSKVSIQTLPGFAELAEGKVAFSDLRELDIEDLLGRDPVEPNQLLLVRNIIGKAVLVTGAGGSIGSELCRQILALRPRALLLVEISEYALYSIHQELEAEIADLGENAPKLVPLLASVQDEARMTEIIGAWLPDTIFHAAAYKHVPLVEHNPGEGVSNNVFGTLTVASVAQKHNVRNVVLISTDKAVRPTNVMGTTKRLAEMVLQALAAETSGTIFSMVRFGNVLGSSGSVVPLFRRQIKAGGPVTITHKDVTRYFMSIPEAAQLVIQAGAMAKGGDVFVLDMGEPVRIMDLARHMIELSGLRVKDDTAPDGDIEIEVVGLRPGEKLYEELLIGNATEGTTHPRIMKANEDMLSWQALGPALERLKGSIESNAPEPLRAQLCALVPNFSPQSGVVDWVFLENTKHSAG